MMMVAQQDINLPNLRVRKGDPIPPVWQYGEPRRQLIAKLGVGCIAVAPKQEPLGAENDASPELELIKKLGLVNVMAPAPIAGGIISGDKVSPKHKPAKSCTKAG